MKKIYLVLALFIGVVIYIGLDNLVEKMPEVTIAEHDQLIMYSLTTCSNCKEKRRELTTAKIPFTEIMVDRDYQQSKLWGERLAMAGFKPGQIGYPSFDVRGTIIINNPSLMQVRAHLENK